MRLGEVVDRMRVQIDRAGSDLVQVRLPEMRARLLDQRDLRHTAATQLVTQPSGQLEPACPTAHDHDAM